MAKTPTQYETITMLDGRVVEFPGKRKILKSSEVGSDGTVAVRIDFRNGETRLFKSNDVSLNLRAAAHGFEQKLGDETAGLEDLDDAVEAIDQMIERLAKGEWNQEREASGLAGTSVLARALVEHTGKPIERIKEFLRNKTAAEKTALRASPAIKPIVDRLEAAKASKAKSVDTEALLGELG